MDGEIIEAKPSGRWKLAIVLLPTLLLLSAGGAVWFHWHQGKQTGVDARLAMQSAALNEGEIGDHLTKLTIYAGERGWQSEEGRRGLRRSIAYVDGTLSPQNYGFRVRREGDLSLAGDRWPILWVDHADENPEQWLMVWVAYDGDPEDLAVTLAVINAMREETLPRGIRFAFLARNSPSSARSVEREEAEMVRAGRQLWIRGVGKEQIRVAKRNEENGPDYAREPLPEGNFEMSLEGSGGLLPRAGLLERARWLQGFLSRAAGK